MAEQTIDQLNVEVNSKAKSGTTAIDKLAESIEKLKSATSGGVNGLTGIAASLEKLDNVVNGLKGKSGTVSSLVNSMAKLNDVKTGSIYKNVNSLVESLRSLSSMDSGLKTIISDLATLSRSGTGSTAMNSLKLQAQAAKTQAAIDKSSLTSAKAQEGLKAIAEKNRQIEETARAAATQEQELTDSINLAIEEHKEQFGSVGAFSNKAADLGAVMPDYEEEAPVLTESALKSKGTPYSIDDSIKNLKATMDAVDGASEKTMSKISTGSSRATGFVDRLKQSFSGVKEKLSGLNSTSNSFFSMGRFYGWYFIMRQAANIFGGWINSINSFIENQNLFAVAMGKSAQSGRQLANSLQSVLGVDSGEAMRYMGLFQQMATSFGITNKQAAIMSDNFTQLGYDIASFYNISTSDAFTKLQSGLAGQTRSLRTLGIDISQARLQQELYNLGIKEKVSDLNEADKAELIYIATMKQTTNAQGDMARTIQTPANALRVLQAQLTITGRAIGSIFIPALEAILPAVTAVVEVIGDLASELASFLGFQLPKIDYSTLKPMGADLDNVSNSAGGAAKGIDDVNNGIDDTGKKAKETNKEVRDLISGFDELNILQDNKADSAATSGLGKKKKGTGTGGLGSILGGVDLPAYDALSGTISNRIDALKGKIKDFLNAFRNDPLTTFADALWGVGGAFDGLFGWLSKMDYADALNGITAAVMAYGITKNPLLALAIGAVVTALSHLFPEKAKIDILSGSLATLGGALVLQKFTGMPFKLALGVSALATSGLVKLMGKDNAINLLASSLTCLGTGMLAFSFTGNLPLAVAIGTTSAAISGLAIHFTDMQIAPALLAGVTAGLLSFKLGLSDWTSGAVGIGVAIASFAELNHIAPEARTALLSIAGAVTALGLAFQAGFGPEGLIIAAVAGAFTGLGAGIIQASEDAKKADLEKRFGSIKLSASEVEDIAKRLTTTPWTVKIDAAISAKNKVAEFEKSLKSDIETLNKMNWEVSIGLKLTKSEMSTYKETISSFISDAKSYVQQQHYSVTLAISAAYEPGSASAANLQHFADSYYGGASVKLNKLGGELADVVNKALEDGILTKDESATIAKKEQQMQTIIDKIANAKYEAQLDNLAVGVNADSFNSLHNQVQKDAQDRLSSAQDVMLTAKTTANLQFDESKQTAADAAARDKAIAEAQATFDKKQAELKLPGAKWDISALTNSYKDVLAKAQPQLGKSVGSMFNDAYLYGIGNYYYQNSDDLKKSFEKRDTFTLDAFKKTYVDDLKKLNVSDAERGNIKNFYEKSLIPDVKTYEDIADAAKKAGKSVPTETAKGLSDAQSLGAIALNADAINYMLGKKFSSDTSALNALATVKDYGKNMDKNMAQGLTDNLQFATDASGKTITGIRDTVTGKVIEITPTLKKNLQDLGINMSNSLVNSTSDTISDGGGTVHKAIIGWWDGKPYYAEASNCGAKLGVAFTNGFRQWLIDHGQTPVRFNFETGHLEQAGETGYVSWHATGGIVNSPQVVGVGEAGPEAIVPLSEDSAWIEKVATISKKSEDSGKGASGNEGRLVSLMRMAFASALKEADGTVTVPVNVNVDGEPIAQHVYKIQKRNEHRYS